MRRILGSLLPMALCAGASFASVRSPNPSGSLFAAPPCAVLDDAVTEPETDVVFPTALHAPGSPAESDDQVLAGCGVREKFVFDVYAVGLYVDPLAAHEQLAAHRAESGKQLAKDAAFYADLASDALPKTLRLVMVRDVDADDMRSAFEDALRPRMVEGRVGAEREAALAALATFKGYFRKEYVEGTEMLLALRPGGKLTAVVDGDLLGGVTSRALTDAVVDVYLGKDPISDDAKEAFGKGMPRVFERGRQLAERAADEAAAEAERRASGSDAQDGETSGETSGEPSDASAREPRATDGDEPRDAAFDASWTNARGGASDAGDGRILGDGSDPLASSGDDAQEALARQRRRVEQATDLLRPAAAVAARDSLDDLLDGAAHLLGDLRLDDHLDSLHATLHGHWRVADRALFAELDGLPPCPCEDEDAWRAADDLDAMLAWLADVRGELARRIDAAPRPSFGT
ncbi:MAG: chalcone isomerase family protein [Planctomycetes bacterium]|nr:chalcone isomerase family protein [Planctomycetota bacterium]